MELDLKRLKNEILGLRHGRSTASLRNLIASDPVLAAREFGLADGVGETVRIKAEEAQARYDLDKRTRIISSPLLRAVETAEILANVLGVTVTDHADELVERWYGELDGRSGRWYLPVWALDTLYTADHRRWGVESVIAVASRVFRLIDRLETEHSGERFIFVSHGDVLHIAETLFRGLNPRWHRLRVHKFHNAEMRRLGGSQRLQT